MSVKRVFDSQIDFHTVNVLRISFTKVSFAPDKTSDSSEHGNKRRNTKDKQQL